MIGGVRPKVLPHLFTEASTYILVNNSNTFVDLGITCAQIFVMDYCLPWVYFLLSCALTCGVTHWKLDKDGIVAMTEPRVFTRDTEEADSLNTDSHDSIFSLLERRYMSPSQRCSATNSMCQNQCT